MRAHPIFRTAAATLLVAFAVQLVALAAVPGRKAAYVGGTAVEFPGARDPIAGTIDTSRPDVLIFVGDRKPFKGATLTIPYESVVDLEYGQKAGRRVGATVGTTILLGPLGLLTLFSKKRNHFLTIGYRDSAGQEQVAVIELGKDIVRTAIKVIETRSGKALEFQDEEARKTLGGGRS
jgi:hypothetical protein